MENYIRQLTMKMTNNFKFTPGWLSGFTQADGSFMVIFTKQKHGNIPYRPRPIFVLTQTNRENNIIEALHKYLGVGYLRKSKESTYIIVDSRKDLINNIIPHFIQYPVIGGKIEAFGIFYQVVVEIEKGIHLTKEGFFKILETCYFINATTRRTLESKNKIIKARHLKK